MGIIKYNAGADTLYIDLKKNGGIQHTIEATPDIFLDMDADDRLVGIQVMNAGKVCPEDFLAKLNEEV